MTPPDQGGPVNSLPGFILVVALSVGAFWIGEIPLPVARPPADEFAPDRYAEIQQYDARLWQDPFEVIKKVDNGEAVNQSVCIAVMAVADHGHDNHQHNMSLMADSPQQTDLCGTITMQEMNRITAGVTVVAVMVPGEPYAEDAETRRRIRYAVVSGLARSGYTPYNGRHMGLTRVSLDKVGIPASVHVPFEFFLPMDEKHPPLLVLWVNEGSMHKRPIHGLQEVVRNTGISLAKSEIVVLGPTNSDTLHEMLREVGNTGAVDTCSFKLRIYSPRATAEDAQLLQGLARVCQTGKPCEGIAGFLKAKKLTDRIVFQRTIATDRSLVKSLVGELGLRGVKPGDGIVLVSEWDTLYGRALPQSFMEEIQKQYEADNGKGAHKHAGVATDQEAVCPPLSICQFSYLRGLDGVLPGESADRKSVAGGKVTDKEKAHIEAAFGNQRIDHLRRIALRIADLDQEMKQKGYRQGVKAIGVLGSDVYDKLLILRALRPRFPEVIFFTTDLDARLLHPSERAAARNLVVAAGYGLRLNGWLQRDIPDFRDSYQSAYFLSMQLALLEPEYRREQAMKILASWSESPRIFEIGRSRPVDLSVTVANTAECHPDTCSSPHPGAHAAGKHIWYGLMPLLLLLLYWYSLNRTVVAGFLHEAYKGIGEPLRQSPGPWYRQVHRLLSDKWLWGLILALLFVVWLGWEFYQIGRNIFLPELAARGEPFFWFEGVSIWPSVMLRALAGLLAFYFLLRGMYLLRKNDEKLTGQFFADHKQTILDHARPSLLERLWHCLVRTRFCRVCLLGWLPRRLTGVQRRYKKAVFLWRDAVQPYSRAALLGRMLLTLILVMAFLIPLVSLFPFEPPNTPFRGAESRSINLHILLFAVFSFLLLLVFVIDTTRRTSRLARCLGNHATWPENAMQQTGCADTNVHYCEEWLNIQLIAARTAIVGGFVYYPFVVLSLIIMSRSPIFDNWLISPKLAMIFAFYLLVLIVCTLLLRNAAETARSNMLLSLTWKIIEARGNDAPDHRIRHMESMRDDIKAERRGAFSSYLDQPWLKALLLPIGSYSGLQLLEYLSYLKL